MAKPKQPLLSLGATGTLGKVITYQHRHGKPHARKKPIPTDLKTLAQLSWRHMYQKAIALWHALSAAEQREWESLARPKHMIGFAYFISLALKPNPGLYLPLQGGTMSGDIDMAKNRLLKLPLPTDGQEAASKNYVDTAVATATYTEGAVAYHTGAQAIPDATATILSWNLENYDTDNIHNPAVNNSRLTCRTEGKYFITGNIGFAANTVGKRQVNLSINGVQASNPTMVERPVGVLTAVSLWTELAGLFSLVVGDYLELKVYQNSGAPLDVIYGANFGMQRIG